MWEPRNRNAEIHTRPAPSLPASQTGVGRSPMQRGSFSSSCPSALWTYYVPGPVLRPSRPSCESSQQPREGATTLTPLYPGGHGGWGRAETDPAPQHCPQSAGSLRHPPSTATQCRGPAPCWGITLPAIDHLRAPRGDQPTDVYVKGDRWRKGGRTGCGRRSGSADGCTDEGTGDGQLEEGMDRQMGGCVSGLMMGARKDGRTDRQMVGWMGRRTGGQVGR